LILVDGNYFKPFTYYNDSTETIVSVPHETVEKGDATYMGIASASILAKTARDQYVLDCCRENPQLVEWYGMNTNMGYGTKRHIEGIRQYGFTDQHRKTFRISNL
jgi:ribonuclease HII